MTLEAHLRDLLERGLLDFPFPGSGSTPARHRALAQTGRENLSLARLVEAHADAVAILAEAGRAPYPHALYGVWAAEIPGRPLQLEPDGSDFILNGVKMFCTGAALVDRALITVLLPEPRLIDLDLRSNKDHSTFDSANWVSSAFAETQTATAAFHDARLRADDLIGGPEWYLNRPGFWLGACGPAACWAGGALGLVDYARKQKRNDPHTMAHLGAMEADAWALWSYLDTAGREIDVDPCNSEAALSRALALRHLIEQTATDVLRRFARAYGPHPLAFDPQISQRCQELELYIRQSHAERDLETLGAHVQRHPLCQ